MTVIFTSDGSINPAKGGRGGMPGDNAKAFKRTIDGKLIELPNCHQITIKHGETIVSYSAGGGGYGNPRRRDIERVAEDFNEGWISKERAKDAYGVIIDSAGIVNKEMTLALRG